MSRYRVSFSKLRVFLVDETGSKTALRRVKSGVHGLMC